MINMLLQVIAPHYCYGCGKVGMLLCENCKYDITDDPFAGCIVCARPSDTGICKSCHSSYEKAWCVGERIDILQRIIDAYKFERVKDADRVLASLLDRTLPILPRNTIVVHVPTVQSHIRRRGYDHARSLAKRFAIMRGLEHKSVIERLHSNEQRGLNKKERLNQASQAFRCNEQLDPGAVYLLIDDVVTTNATLRFAAEELKNAGAAKVWVAVLARQPLEKDKKDPGR